MTAYLSPVEVTVLVPAGPSEVFGFFTDPARYVQWMGSEASLEPVPGGEYRVRMPDGFEAAGRFIRVEPPHLVVFSWGFADDEAASRTKHEGGGGPGRASASVMPAGSTPGHGDASPGRRRHPSGAAAREPAERVAARGARHRLDTYLPRLAVRAAGGDPGADPHS